jgi:class 3 adenylate cyclase/dihydrofolate reductase
MSCGSDIEAGRQPNERGPAAASLAAMKLVVTSFVTVDGIVEAPGFDEHRSGRNAWALRVQNDEDEEYNKAQAMSADALLLGRRTWQIWAAFWPTASGGDPELAEQMNRIPKYVVSKTLKRADWSNSTIISGDVPAEVAKLKSRPGGDLMVFGSPDLVDELLRHDLVDEFRLQVYPVILGSGKRLFRDRIDTHHLRLVDSRTFSSGVVLLTYAPDTEVPTSRFVDQYQWTHEQIRSLQAAEDIDRTLATVLFADIVDSTGRAAAMGDRAWKKLLEQHQRVVHGEIERWHGQNVEFTGDGVMAIFDAPTRALRCAFELVEAARGLDVEIRAGIHTGEVERRETGVAGIAVHVAARLLGSAEGGQVVVTKTVRDLGTGTDLEFRPLGDATLRGVPGQWELFEAKTSER